VDKHLLILNTIVTDLTNDVKDIIDFMTYTKNGTMLTHLLPIETIVTELREATILLTSGLYFPFKIQTANWQIIQKYIVTTRITITLTYIYIYNIKISDCSISECTK